MVIQGEDGFLDCSGNFSYNTVNSHWIDPWLAVSSETSPQLSRLNTKVCLWKLCYNGISTNLMLCN